MSLNVEKYLPRLTTVEVVKVTDENLGEVADWFNKRTRHALDVRATDGHILSSGGRSVARVDQYVIIEGEVWFDTVDADELDLYYIKTTDEG